MEGERGFDGSRVRLDEQVFKELVEALVHGTCGGKVVGERKVYELNDFCGDKVGGHADDSDGTGCDEGECETVVAREDLEGIGECGAQLRDAVDVASCFLDGNDVWAGVGEARNRFDRDFHAATSGDAVEHDGKLGF